MYWRILLFCLYSGFAFGQTQIQGKITDSKKQPIFATNVFSKSTPEKGVATDFDGNFTLAISNTNDVLVISYIGYKTREINLSTIDFTKPLAIVLQEDSRLLSEVIVKARDPISEKFSATKLSTLDIYFNPVSQGDPLKAITILPASTTTDETANPSLRGSTPDRTRVTLNSVPIYTPVRSSQLNNQGSFSLFNAEMIHRQYVYASNPPLTYGNTSAGLVEIQTRKSLSRNQYQFSLGLGNIGFFLSQKIKKKQHTFLQFYGNHKRSEAFLSIQKKNFPRLNSFHTTDVGLNFHSKLSEKSEINSFNYYITEDFDVNHSNINYTGKICADKQRFLNVTNFTHYTPQGSLHINLGWNTSQQHFSYGNILSNKDINQLYTSASFKGEIGKSLHFQTGVSLDFHQYKFNDSIPQYYFAIAPEAPQIASVTNSKNYIAEAYYYTDWRLNNALNISAGLRTNIPTNEQRHYLSSQIGIKYTIDTHQNILLSGGNYNSYATPNYYAKNFSLLNAKQIAFDYSFQKKNFSFKTAVYYKNEKGQQAFNSYTNIDKVQTLGFEIFGEFRFAKHFNITASNLFIDQKLHKNKEKYHGKYDLDYLAKVSLQYRNLKLFTASISYIGRPGNYYTPLKDTTQKSGFGYIIPIWGTTNSAQYNNYNKIDFSINRFTPLKNAGAIIPYLSITNIFNIKNEKSNYYSPDFSRQYFNQYRNRTIYFGVIWEL